ncbi:MAG: porin family protein, partial [Hyphomonadaceae bacterium]
MRKLAMLAAAAAVLGFPAAASAQEGVYLGAGYTHFSGDDADVGGITGRLGYRFHPNIAVEGEGTFGVVDDDPVELDSSWGVYGVGILPVSPEFDLFARVGYHNTEVSGGPITVEEDGVAYGAGAQWNLSDRFGIRGEYTRLEGDDDGVDTFGLSGV